MRSESLGTGRTVGSAGIGRVSSAVGAAEAGTLVDPGRAGVSAACARGAGADSANCLAGLCRRRDPEPAVRGEGWAGMVVGGASIQPGDRRGTTIVGGEARGRRTATGRS